MAIKDTVNSELKPKSNFTVSIQGGLLNDFAKEDLIRQPRDRTPKPSRGNLSQFYEVVRLAVDNLQTRSGVKAEDKVIITEEGLNKEISTEIITVNCIERMPGSYSGGSPGEGKVKNLRPIIRESIPDEQNPGYTVDVLGYYHDNVIRFTCWAQTNKRANYRADWFENLMDEFSWYFKAEGIQRVIFIGRREDIIEEVNENRWYGRPIDFFVRTEKIRALSKKTIDEIEIKVAAALRS